MLLSCGTISIWKTGRVYIRMCAIGNECLTVAHFSVYVLCPIYNIYIPKEDVCKLPIRYVQLVCIVAGVFFSGVLNIT